MVDIEALLDQVPALEGTPRTVEELSGGLTNQNLKVTTPTGEYVVRLGPQRQLVAGHRPRRRVVQHAGRRGLRRRRAVRRLPRRPRRARDRLRRRPQLRQRGPARPGALPRVATAMRLLHAGPRFSTDFDMFVRQPTYLRTCVSRGFPIPDDYVSYGADFLRIQGALASRPLPTVPCNNDLLAGNIVDDGERIWLDRLRLRRQQRRLLRARQHAGPSAGWTTSTSTSWSPRTWVTRTRR